MTRCRLLTATTGVVAVLLGAMACTGADDDAAAASSPSTPSATPPTLAGAEVATAVAPLPAGPATGWAVLSYSGVGRLDEPFSGDCAHTGDTTLIAGSADTAQIRLEVGPDGARLVLTDIGFSAQSELAAGRYEVSGAHLSLDAPLASDDQVVGTAQLEIYCG